MPNQNFLKLLLWLGVIYHGAVGLIGIFAKGLIGPVARNLYGFNLTVTDEIVYVVDPLAALMVTMAVVLYFCARDPVKYHALVYIVPGLMALRLAQMLVFSATAPAGLSLMNKGSFAFMLVITAGYGAAVLIAALRARKGVSH